MNVIQRLIIANVTLWTSLHPAAGSMQVQPRTADPSINHVVFATYGEQGKRPSMEDAHYPREHDIKNVVLLPKKAQCCAWLRAFCCRSKPATHVTAFAGTAQQDESFFGIYDGHGGIEAAKFTASNLHQNIVPRLNTIYRPEKTIVAGYEKTDRDFLNATTVHTNAGTTVVTALIKDETLYFAHAGDARAILSVAGKVALETHDHKPDNDKERTRIEALGGRVIHYGVWRVQGILAVSRAIGDKKLKQYVPPTPDVCSRPLDGFEEFMILACDGLWDVMSNQEAIDFVHAKMRKLNITHKTATPFHALAIAKELVVHAIYKRGSTDNVSITIVFLQGQ